MAPRLEGPLMVGGHGHVVLRPDGAKARCGGPACCSECARELAAVIAEPAHRPGVAFYCDVPAGYEGGKFAVMPNGDVVFIALNRMPVIVPVRRMAASEKT